MFAEKKYSFDDFGLISIMYHRFDESKYPSTNIQMDVFKKQLDIITSEGIKFIHPKNFKKSLYENKKDRKILFTVDDGLLSFYKNPISGCIFGKNYSYYFLILSFYF